MTTRISPLAVSWICARALAQGSVGAVRNSLHPRSDRQAHEAPRAPGQVINLSLLAQAGPPDVNPLIAGFVLAGAVSRQVLIRAVGPTLKHLGLRGGLAALQLALFRGTTLLDSNARWEQVDAASAALTRNASHRVGAFALPSGSGDAALVMTLSPDTYTVQVSSADLSSGLALLEVYDVP